jgi:hypothetical protein
VKSSSAPTLSPQDYLDGMVKSRGYSSTSCSTLSTAYYNKPSPFQLASYGVYMINLVRDGDVQGLQEALDLGLSPNACNAYGESIVHNVCRRSDDQMLDVLLRAGCEIQISDDNGRTPMHDACWTAQPNFLIVEKLLDRDIQLLFMSDNHGFLPLSYTRKDHWSEWLQFLQSKKDTYWPRTKVDVLDLTLSMPHTRPIRDPEKKLSLELSRMVAGGKLIPEEVQFLIDDAEHGHEKARDCNDDVESFDGNDDDTNDESISSILESSASSNMIDGSWNSAEMNKILNSLSKPTCAPLAW